MNKCQDNSTVVFSRARNMPSENTFSITAIRSFVQKYLLQSKVSVDPFARNSRLCDYTNDINPATAAKWHMDAEAFLEMLYTNGVKADCILLDPPYSPRQIIECYRGAGVSVTMQTTQNSRLYRRVRDAALRICTDDAVVLSFGWSSSGMGSGRGFELSEVLLVCHGGAHNDTICIAERRVQSNNLELHLKVKGA